MDIVQKKKTCGRCGHTWSSTTERPSRCPCCGTYHWYGESIEYSCIVCNHKWFSRTNSTPTRCPQCKTRSWRDGPKKYHPSKMNTEDNQVRHILEMYNNGVGCVSIAIETGIPMAKIIETIRILVCDGQTPRM